jgi:AraC-like DNA-binding protein
MFLDFCQHIGDTHIPDGISSEVYVCINYIRSHTNEPIRISDVAAQVHCSTSYIAKRFKAELGTNIGEYINSCKLEDAKNLLIYSDKSLSEISNFLSFSNQSHFQNVFKKEYGVTPMQYRKQMQRL